MSKETPSGMMHYIARQYFFHNKILTTEEVFARLNKITPQYLQTLAKEIFTEKKPTLAAIGCVQDLLPYEKLVELLSKK